MVFKELVARYQETPSRAIGTLVRTIPVLLPVATGAIIAAHSLGEVAHTPSLDSQTLADVLEFPDRQAYLLYLAEKMTGISQGPDARLHVLGTNRTANIDANLNISWKNQRIENNYFKGNLDLLSLGAIANAPVRSGNGLRMEYVTYIDLPFTKTFAQNTLETMLSNQEIAVFRVIDPRQENPIIAEFNWNWQSPYNQIQIVSSSTDVPSPLIQILSNSENLPDLQIPQYVFKDETITKMVNLWKALIIDFRAHPPSQARMERFALTVAQLVPDLIDPTVRG